MKTRFGLSLAHASAIIALFLAPSASQAQATNFITNGGFENGVYNSTAGGYENNGTPDGWTPNGQFNRVNEYDFVSTFKPHSGSYSLEIGAGDYPNPIPTISQTFTDVNGDAYSGSIWVYYAGAGEPGGEDDFAKVLIDGTTEVSLTDTASASWTEFTFSFTGTGSDTLTIEAESNPDAWYFDDVSVVAGGSGGGGGGSTSVPEGGATGLYLLLAAAACFATMLFSSRTIKARLL